MNDQNLVNALREHAEWARANEWETPITLGDDLAEAADRIEAQEKEIEKLRGQVPHWIPVEERLPELDELVLVIASGKPKENITLDNAVELATLYSDGWCLEMWPEWTGATVTHWMPLPEPLEV
jgi:hypothetical protein